jgi:hypothetical protein
MADDPTQKTLENRWLELASGIALVNPGSPVDTYRYVFYAGAASAWAMCAAGETQQLERDVLGFVDFEKREIAAERQHDNG